MKETTGRVREERGTKETKKVLHEKAVSFCGRPKKIRVLEKETRKEKTRGGANRDARSRAEEKQRQRKDKTERAVTEKKTGDKTNVNGKEDTSVKSN